MRRKIVFATLLLVGLSNLKSQDLNPQEEKVVINKSKIERFNAVVINPGSGSLDSAFVQVSFKELVELFTSYQKNEIAFDKSVEGYKTITLANEQAIFIKQKAASKKGLISSL